MDSTLIGIGLTAFASKDMIAKLLGPTCDYLGENLKGFVEKRVENISSIFGKAYEKLGSKADEDGKVDPRILKHVLDEGSFCEDDLTQEYFAGLLAASRSDRDSKANDESLPYLATVEQLSASHLLFHYAIYFSISKKIAVQSINVFEESQLQAISVYFTIQSIAMMMRFRESPEVTSGMSDVCSLLVKEKLISQYRFGNSVGITETEKTPELADAILKINPTLYGLNLFMRANAAPKNILSSRNLPQYKEWIDSLECHVDSSCLPIVK